MPERVQLQHTKGWRMPAGAVKVDRSTRWGNPYRWNEYPATRYDDDGESYRLPDTVLRRFAVVDFESAVVYGIGGWPRNYPGPEEIRAELAGKDLACWCPLIDADGNRGPCHADILLEIANG